MAFKRMPGLKGKVYVPEEVLCVIKKHPCKDCYSCQLCSDDRCRLCLKTRVSHKRRHESTKLVLDQGLGAESRVKTCRDTLNSAKKPNP